MFRGRNKAISGKKYKIKTTRMIDGTNIAAPLKISPKLNSFTAPANTKQFIPTGGVSMPISIIKTIITPNQMRSAPNGSGIGQTGARGRSEERRVGREGRARGVRDDGIADV